MTDILLEFLLGEAESKRHAADAVLEVIAVHRLEPCHEIPIRGKFLRAGIPCCNRVLHPLLFRTERDEVGERAAQLLIERIVGERCLLLNIADRVGTIHHNLSAVVLLASEQNPHQRRLARAVCTDESYLIPAHDLKVHIGKKRTYAIRLFESYDLQTSHITLLHPHARHRGDSHGRRSQSPVYRLHRRPA